MSLAVPYLTSQGRSSYQDFLLMDVPRAMAVASSGQYGWYGGGHSIEDARARALKSCADKGGADCAIYAEDLQVVWQGRPPQQLPPVPGPLIATRDYAFAPDARFFWWGPQTARGVCWSGGTAKATAMTGADSNHLTGCVPSTTAASISFASSVSPLRTLPTLRRSGCTAG